SADITRSLSPSLDERAAGETEEDVFQRRPPDERALRPDAAPMHFGRRGLAVSRVQEETVGELLDAIGKPVELAVERLLDAGLEPELENLAGRVLIDELPW